MISKKEIIGIAITFALIYFIIYVDHRLSQKCKCKDCYLNMNKISLKSPIILTIMCFVIYKLSFSYLSSYFGGSLKIVKQNIITDVADF
jgi:hypothetical protein